LIGGTLAKAHFAFEQPFVFLLHSNVDRLWASWQLQPEKVWRLNPDETYERESVDETINEFMEPWAGGTVHLEQKMRPWRIDWPAEKKNAQDNSVVKPPNYDKYANIS
jgi:hypothetical protein